MMKPKKRRPSPHFTTAFVSMDEAELGRHGTSGGRTVSVVFRDGQGKKVGELRISAARVRWLRPSAKKPVVIPSTRLDELFSTWRALHKRGGRPVR